MNSSRRWRFMAASGAAWFAAVPATARPLGTCPTAEFGKGGPIVEAAGIKAE